MWRSLIFVGAGGHAVSCAEVAHAVGYKQFVFVDRGSAGQTLLGFPVVSDISDAVADPLRSIFIAIGDNATRERVAVEIAGRFPDAEFPSLTHPKASVSAFSAVGPGSVVMAGAVIGSNTRCGRFCIINTRSSIDHDCLMSDFSSLAPGAVTGGRVTIGERSAISIGAVIKNGVRIGDDVVVGACAYVNRSLGESIVCWGVPARIVRSRRRGDPYLS